MGIDEFARLIVIKGHGKLPMKQVRMGLKYADELLDGKLYLLVRNPEREVMDLYTTTSSTSGDSYSITWKPKPVRRRKRGKRKV